MSEQYIPKIVPFIPNLEGIYKERFYALVSLWRTEENEKSHIESIENELQQIAQPSKNKTEQYNRYYAVLLLLRDLLNTTWSANFEYGYLMLNTFATTARLNSVDSTEIIKLAKEKLQHCMESSRLRIIEENRDFILKIERGDLPKQIKPISALITDGKFLAEKLRDVISLNIDLRSVIDPMIQLVDNSIDETTGLRLLDIWRYFRYTWSSPAENTPGRSMQYLIRNKALPGCPIMGISSLDNCALAMGPRDEYLGWSVDSFIQKLIEKKFSATKILEQIDSYLSDGIASINAIGLNLTVLQIENPTADFISQLRNSAKNEKDKRRDSLVDDTFKANSEESKNLLFLKKRKEKLASFLDARRQINEYIASRGGKNNFTYDDFKSITPAITVALQAQKEKHIGSSLLELNVCGAIRPYNELLAGKLVAFSALTPFVLDTYKERYKNRPSEIASQMLGEDVVRTPDLVFIGTTSLYSVGSSQYNRLSIPGEKLSSSFDLKYIELEKKTQGFGTFHISRQTMDAMETVLKKNGSQTINHQFGEGASPKLRLLGEGVRALLKSNGESSVSSFTSHAMPRIIYAVPLISNLFEYLLGIDEKPTYYGLRDLGDAGTQKIIDFWIDRWLRKRLEYLPAVDRVAAFDLENEENKYLVGKLLNQEEEIKMPTGKNVITADNVGFGEAEQIKFLRKFYKNGSAYSDSTPLSTLKAIHIKTNIDDAILNAVRNGKDCVLTGNPGDGKTHIFRVLEEEIKKINQQIEPVYDASTLTTDSILEKWFAAKKNGIPFLIAINASVLYELNQVADKQNFPVVHEAYSQFENGIIYGDTPDFNNHSVIVFDMGLRSVLAPNVVSGVIDKIANSDNFKCCKCCFYKECGFRKHAEIINSQRFRDRIQNILSRVDLVGWHITIRDVQAFFSYLVFWNHSCKDVLQESETDKYKIENLIYKEGRGNLFKAIREVFDPAQISMPELDEDLVIGNFAVDDWLPGAAESISATDGVSLDDFNRRKRAFYFFHKKGDQLLKNKKRNSVANFEDFLKLPEKKQRNDILNRLRTFIGDREKNDDSKLPVWRGFRFDTSSRRVILSMGSIAYSHFSIFKPRLLPSMENGLAINANYVFLQEEHSKSVLKIDFSMFKILEYSEQKVPIWALEENNNAKKIWRFILNFAK